MIQTLQRALGGGWRPCALIATLALWRGRAGALDGYFDTETPAAHRLFAAWGCFVAACVSTGTPLKIVGRSTDDLSSFRSFRIGGGGLGGRRRRICVAAGEGVDVREAADPRRLLLVFRRPWTL